MAADQTTRDNRERDEFSYEYQAKVCGLDSFSRSIWPRNLRAVVLKRVESNIPTLCRPCSDANTGKSLTCRPCECLSHAVTQSFLFFFSASLTNTYTAPSIIRLQCSVLIMLRHLLVSVLFYEFSRLHRGQRILLSLSTPLSLGFFFRFSFTLSCFFVCLPLSVLFFSSFKVLFVFSLLVFYKWDTTTMLVFYPRRKV